jgi:hypothetical protein
MSHLDCNLEGQLSKGQFYNLARKVWLHTVVRKTREPVARLAAAFRLTGSTAGMNPFEN